MNRLALILDKRQTQQDKKPVSRTILRNRLNPSRINKIMQANLS